MEKSMIVEISMEEEVPNQFKSDAENVY